MDLKLGQEVWYEAEYGKDTLRFGTVAEINPKGLPEGYVVLENEDDDNHIYKKYIDSKYCYESEDALRSALEDERKQGVAKYTSQISSVEDLVQFMYERLDCNHVEKEAIKEMTEKFVGIDLDNRAVTNKFLLYDLNAGGFVAENGSVQDNDIQSAAIYSEKSAKSRALSVDEESFLKIPLTQDFVDSLPFDLADTAPQVAHSKTMDREAALEGDFVVLTDLGFYDEKYNSSTNTSRPKIRGFELDYANLYNMDKLREMGTEGITEGNSQDMGSKPIIIPVSKQQQEKLMALDAFSPEKEPHGFFQEPIGDTQKEEAMPDLSDALDALEAEATQMDLPWSV